MLSRAEAAAEKNAVCSHWAGEWKRIIVLFNFCDFLATTIHCFLLIRTKKIIPTNKFLKH